MSIGNAPTREAAGASWSPSWRNWFQAVFEACASVYSSGTTANRPTVGLWTGRQYFDTTLGYTISYDGTQWVDSTGSPA